VTCGCGALPEPIGALKVMQSHILNNSHKKQTAFALAGSISTMSTLLGQRFVFKGTSPNLYTLLLGGSGSGKHAPQIYSHKMLVDAHQSTLLGSGSYVSDASLMDTLSDRPVRLDLLDEASGILKTITGAGSDYTARMADILCNLWSVSNGIFLGRTMASKKPTKCKECKEDIDDDSVKGKCYRPNLNLIMATTYTGLEESVTLSALDKGLLGRFLVFVADEDSELEDNIADTSLDIETTELLESYRKLPIPLNKKYFNDGVSYPVKEVLLGDKDAESVYNEYYNRFRKLSKDASVELQPIIARMPQQFKKIAMCHAAGRTTADEFSILSEDLTFSFNLCMYNLNVFSDIVDKYLFRTALEKEYKMVQRIINNACEILIDDIVLELRPYLKRKRIIEIVEELEISKEITRVISTTGELGVRIL
jgi:hypothetical protein